NEPLGSDARLAVVDGARRDSGGRGLFEVGTAHDDERVAAAELQHTLLQALARRLRDCRTGAVAARQRDRTYARVADDEIHGIGLDEQRLEHTLVESGAPQDVLDRERTLRHVRRVLEQSGIAGHQAWRDESEYLPEREVPRHYGEHRTDRLILHEAPATLRGDLLVSEKLPGMVGIVAAYPRALLRLRDGSADRLAHLERHHASELLLLAVENVGRGAHPPGSLRHRCTAVRGERADGQCELRFECV